MTRVDLAINAQTYMKYVRELEAWSKPGRLLHPDFGKIVLKNEMWKEGIPRDVFLGVSNIPSPIHCENLRLCIRDGEFTEDEFFAFCTPRSLPTHLMSEQSACLFLEYMQGACQAWIHLPADADEALLLKIVKLLDDRDLVLIDPYTMERLV